MHSIVGLSITGLLARKILLSSKTLAFTLVLQFQKSNLMPDCKVLFLMVQNLQSVQHLITHK